MVDTKDILSRFKENEEEAFQALFDVYYEPLLLYCHRMIRDVENAEDVVQDCFVHLWYSRRLENFSGELDRFMFQAVRFRAINYIRSRKRRDALHDKASTEEFVFPVVSLEGQSLEQVELLYCTINQLPPECRKIFLMACLDDMKYQEIADALHVSVNTVKTQMKLALRFLRMHLNKESFSLILFFLYGVKNF